ncbi:MAG: glycosyltransferase family 8 protein [Lachnospiraceae bacterium]|nr:glycosyltransferase family 8 protein [Lachnospiraceae bacterium]
MMMNVVSALNDKYVPYTYVMLYSLFENNRSRDIAVYLLQADLSDASKKDLSELAEGYGNEMHFVKMDRDAFDDRLLATHDWSMETCFRLAMNDVLPADLDRVIYLDGDMIINKDISPLYDMAFKNDKHLIVTHDMTMTPDSGEVYGDLHTEVFNRLIRENKYFNAGMILMDFAWLRQHYGYSDYIKMAEGLDFEIFAPDQDLLNLMHEGQTQFVDAWEYDLFACNAFIKNYDYDRVKKDVSIIHYVGEKPWRGGSHFHYGVEQLWWDYALGTDYADGLLDGFISTHFGESKFYDAIHQAEQFNDNIRGEITAAITTFKKLYALVNGQSGDVPESDEVFADVPDRRVIPDASENISMTRDEKIDFVRRVISDGSVESYVSDLRRENTSLQAQLDEALKACETLRGVLQ